MFPSALCKPKTEVRTGISKIASLQSSRCPCWSHSAAPLLLDSRASCRCPAWDGVFLRFFSAAEQTNSGCCWQRCDRGCRRPTSCFTWVYFQKCETQKLVLQSRRCSKTLLELRGRVVAHKRRKTKDVLMPISKYILKKRTTNVPVMIDCRSKPAPPIHKC